MASAPAVTTQKITRDQIAALVGQNHRAIKLIEDLASDVSATLPDYAMATQALAELTKSTADIAQALANQALGETDALRVPSYVAIAASGTLTNERVLTGSTNIALTDGGAGNAVTVAITPNITGSALNMTIQPHAPSATQDAGTLFLQGALATGASHVGGNVFILGGDGPIGGGGVLAAGNATTTNGSGGDFGVNAGNAGSVSGIPGNVFFAPGGAAGRAGGYISFASGNNATSVITVTDDGTNDQLSFFGATPVAQSTGWGAPTGTATKTAFNTATVTLSQLAERVKAMIDYAKLRGDYGP